MQSYDENIKKLVGLIKLFSREKAYKEMELDFLDNKEVLVSKLKQCKIVLQKIEETKIEIKVIDLKIIRLNQSIKSNKKMKKFFIIVIGIIATLIYLSVFAGIISKIVLGLIILFSASIIIGCSEEVKTIKNVKIPTVEKERKDIINELKEYLFTDETIILEKLIPRKYFSLYAVVTFIELLENHRAKNFGEAINLYEEIEHKNRVENILSKNGKKLDDFNRAVKTDLEQIGDKIDRVSFLQLIDLFNKK